MLSIYNYKDFRKFVKDVFHGMPRQGYGQSHRLAKHLNVHTTLISQILGGRKSFSLEQAHEVAEYLGLNELETDYFVTLIQLEKAGTKPLRAYFEKKLAGVKGRASELVNRLKSERGMSEEMRAVFYSHWK